MPEAFVKPRKTLQGVWSESANSRLLRYSFPNGRGFLDISQAEFECVLDLIDRGPLKRLNMRTLFDVFLKAIALA